MRLPSRRARGLTLLVALGTAISPSAARAPFLPTENDGDAAIVRDSNRPAVVAAFPRESYRLGDVARLVVTGREREVAVRVFRAGTDPGRLTASDVMTGTPVSGTTLFGPVEGRRTIAVKLGSWPSGVYYARLTAPGHRIGYAPFVLRPRRLGEHRVAVVMPTQTWQAYNRRDENGDGEGDTWYADPLRHTARLGRPFLDRGTPPHWKSNDLPYLQWLAATNHQADYLADSDLGAVRRSRELRSAYSLIVFPGHHEYVTSHEYEVIRGYRNLGGHLIFLSANNFFWQIVKRGNLMIRTRQWRDLGRPEAALIGVEYFHNDNGRRRAPWVIRKSPADSWLLAGADLTPGSKISSGGIEADRVTADSPRGVTVIAEIPNLYGPEMTAQMTYYESKRGAEVFAVGAFGLAGAAPDPRVSRLLANLWNRLAGPKAAAGILSGSPTS
jgi:hypothetical protein